MNRLFFIILISIVSCENLFAQEPFPINGVEDNRENHYAFFNANIVVDYNTTIENGILIIKNGKIISVGKDINIPNGVRKFDLNGYLKLETNIYLEKYLRKRKKPGRSNLKNGSNQSVRPLQDAKTPWGCPECGKSMDKLDVKTFRAVTKCYDCVAKEESRLKMDGEWDQYKEKKILQNQMDWLKDRIVELTYYYETLSNPEIYHFDEDSAKVLMIDKYSIPIDTVKKDIKAEVVGMNKSLKEKEKEYEEKYGEAHGAVRTTQD